MYAIIETGSKQYKVTKGDIIEVERLPVAPSKTVRFDTVLLYADGKTVEVGSPYVKGARVLCDVLSQMRGEKLIAFKYRRRKGSKKKIGHRQELTQLKVADIEVA